jgi:uncharacterized peroxidase-related enzyme
MPHLPLPEHLPGITGLLEYRKESAEPIRALTQLLLRGPSSLSEGERELIATLVSSKNNCKFCTAAHKSAADILLGEQVTCAAVIEDFESAQISAKMKSLLAIAAAVQKSGKAVHETMIKQAKAQGATDREIHDTVLIAALFCLYNKYVDGTNSITPVDETFYHYLGERITNHGYIRLPQGYDHLKK